MLAFEGFTWRVGGLSKQSFYGVISTLKGTLVGVMVLVTLENDYLLNPSSLLVGFRMIKILFGF